MASRQVLLSNPGSQGFEYGVLRDFEDEICRIAGAERVPLPTWRDLPQVIGRVGHGTRWAPLRKLLPKDTRLRVEADVVWCVLMGPEASPFDLLGAWDREVRRKVLYLFDTFEIHFPSIRRLLSATRWDLCITSFACAVPLLERATGRPWVSVAQGARLERFAPAPFAERGIAVSAYGRRAPRVHEAVQSWAASRDLYYDFSTSTAVRADVTSDDLYRQYAWHLCASDATFNWPVEVTHPDRAGGLSPVTARWFEAAAAGTPIIGRAPADPEFDRWFDRDTLTELDPSASEAEVHRVLDRAFDDRSESLARARDHRERRGKSWTWAARAGEILERLDDRGGRA